MTSYHVIILFLTIFGVQSLNVTEEYDEKLSNFLREILENFRDQMEEGIIEIGIPPMDPLSIPDVNKDINDSSTQLQLRMNRLTISGLSKFQLEELRADLGFGFVDVVVTLPHLRADGYCYMNGKVVGIFPITSDGPFAINVSNVWIKGYGNLTITSGESTRVHMNDLQLALSFGPLDIEFSSLLGGKSFAKTLVRLLSGLGPGIFQYFHQAAMDRVSQALLQVINKELDKGTLVDLLGELPLSHAEEDMSLG